MHGSLSCPPPTQYEPNRAVGLPPTGWCVGRGAAVQRRVSRWHAHAIGGDLSARVGRRRRVYSWWTDLHTANIAIRPRLGRELSR